MHFIAFLGKFLCSVVSKVARKEETNMNPTIQHVFEMLKKIVIYALV